MTASKAAAASAAKPTVGVFTDRTKPQEIRSSNIAAAKAVADAVRTSLGPKGMDKMIQEPKGDVTITNDGATILQQMKLSHPAAKMLVELSAAQDAEAGDGTTSVVILAGALLDAARTLLERGLHPAAISDSLQLVATECCSILAEMAVPVSLDDRDNLLRLASTALNSKVVHQHSGVLAAIAVDAMLKVIDPAKDHYVDLKDVHITRILGGVVEDTELVEGLVLAQKSGLYGAPSTIQQAKIGLIQFCISPPKTDMDNQVVVSDYTAMDRVLREERNYLIKIVKQIHSTGCNVLLVQKSILRDAVSDMAHHFLGKMKILVVKDIEREQVEFVCKSLGIRPVASLDHFTADALGAAKLVQEVRMGTEKTVKITGIQKPGRTVCVVLRGSNKLVLAEAERSLHDALCVIRCLVKNRALVAGGGAPEMEMSHRLYRKCVECDHSAAGGVQAYCMRAFSEALDVIPYTLAENAGLNAIDSVTDLRARHAEGKQHHGIDVRRGCIRDMLDEHVLQPLLVSQSAITLAIETVRLLLKIDDIINVMN